MEERNKKLPSREKEIPLGLFGQLAAPWQATIIEKNVC